MKNHAKLFLGLTLGVAVVLVVPSFARTGLTTVTESSSSGDTSAQQTPPPVQYIRPAQPNPQPGCIGVTQWTNQGDLNDTRTTCVSNVSPNQNNNSMPQSEIERAYSSCPGGVDWNGDPVNHGNGWKCMPPPNNAYQNNTYQNNGYQNGPDQNFNPGNGGGDPMQDPKFLESEKKRFAKDMGQVQTVKSIQMLLKKIPAGYSASQEILDALAKVASLNLEVQNATDMDVINNARPELMGALDVLRQGENQLKSLNQFPKMEKQAKKELGKLAKKLAQMEAGLSKSGVDATNLVQAAHAGIDDLSANLQKAVQDAKSGNLDDAQSEFGDFFQQLGETWQSVGILEAVRGISKGVSGVEKNIASVKSKIVSIGKNKKVNVSDLLDLLQQASNSVSDLKGMIKSPDFSPDDAMSTFQDLDDIRRQIEDGLAQINDGEHVDINFFPMNMGQVPMFGGPGSGPQGGGQGGPQGPMGGPGGFDQRGGPGF